MYIKGCYIEFDFLILKDTATRVDGLPVYEKEDVIAVLECKTNGVYTLFNDPYELAHFELDRLSSTYFDVLEGPAHGIKLGYMTISENSTAREGCNSNFIRGTIQYMEKKFGQNLHSLDKLWSCFFARCHYTAKTKQDKYMSDSQWEQFVLDLIK